MVCGLFLAILVNTKLKGITFFRGLYYLPVITSTVAIGVVWSWILSPRFGALPRILNNLGVMNVPSFLGDSRYALLTLVVVYIWKMSGYHMILFLAGLQNIPEVYYEAAKIDGATPWQLLRHVTLPLLSTTTFFIMIIALIQSLQTFDLTFAMTEGGPNNASATLSFFTYVNAFVHFRMGYAASMAFVLFLIVGSITLANFWARKYWVSTLD
jgi:multiple sugar transport system permease protein